MEKADGCGTVQNPKWSMLQPLCLRLSILPLWGEICVFFLCAHLLMWQERLKEQVALLSLTLAVLHFQDALILLTVMCVFLVGEFQTVGFPSVHGHIWPMWQTKCISILYLLSTILLAGKAKTLIFFHSLHERGNVIKKEMVMHILLCLCRKWLPTQTQPLSR